MQRSRSIVVAGVTSFALATALTTPGGAQETPPAEVPPEEPTTVPASPPTVPVEPPAELPAVEVPVTAPASPPVRSGKAIDVPVTPVTELPLAPEVGPPPLPEPPPADVPPRRPDAPDPPHRPRETPSRRRPSTDSPGTAPRTTAGPRASSTSIPAAAPPPAPSQHTVVAGEHLWSIAAAQVAAATGRTPADVRAVEIAPYWTQLCMLNEARLRSGDVNLVHPGEVLDLPAG